MNLRWKFVDPSTGDQWTHPINPNTMSAPPLSVKTLRTGSGSRRGVDRLRGFRAPAPAQEWQFGGVIRTREHHDALREWARKDRLIEVHDHLGRVFEVVLTGFTPTDRQPTARTPWRLTYQMRALMLRRTA